MTSRWWGAGKHGLTGGWQKGGVAATSTATWTATTGNKKSSLVAVTNNNLTATGTTGTGAFTTVAATIAGASKIQFEFTVVTSPDGNQSLVGLYNTAAVADVHATAPGFVDANGIGLNFNVGSTALGLYANSGTAQVTTTLGTAVAVGDVYTFVCDRSTSAGSHVITIYRNGTQVLTKTNLTLTNFDTAYFATKSGQGVTANFGGSAFTHALDPGFSIYG